MKKISIALIVVLLLGSGGYGLWRYYQERNSVTVVFNDAQGLVPGAGVWMAGIEIGKVRELQIAGNEVEVKIFLGRENREQLTENALFVIDPGIDNGGSPVVRVKAGPGGGGPLRENARLRGVNSFALWKLNEYSEKMFEYINEPQLQESLKRLEQLGNELTK